MSCTNEQEGAFERAPEERFEMTTLLKQGHTGDYEKLHAAIPSGLDAAMRAAGATGWTIHRNGLVLHHQVTAISSERMRSTLNSSEDNMLWQQQVNPHLDHSAAAPAASSVGGDWSLVWDFSWPVR